VPTGKTKRGRRQAVLDDDAGAKKEKGKTNIHHDETRHWHSRRHKDEGDVTNLYGWVWRWWY
jgi:hypothetical protein